MEQLNLATTLEMRWSGRYAVPTLQGETRVNKPPGLPWLTALTIQDDTIGDLDSPVQATREHARGLLALQARWPVHLMAALIALCAYQLGRTVHSPLAGVIATAVCVSMLLIARYTRNATFDVPLALWAAVGQVCLAHWALQGRRWIGAIGGGLALGLGMLTKGPVIFLFVLVPLLVLLPLLSRRRSEPSRGWIAPLAVLLLLSIAPILPWVFTVAHQIPDAWSRWVAEITRSNATAAPSGRWYKYVVVFRLCLPWTVWVVAGGVLGWRDWRRGVSAGGALLIACVIVPIIVLSLARDRKPHYLLPLACPLAALAGRALAEHVASRERNREDTAVVVAHWLVIGVLVAGVLIAPEAVLAGGDEATGAAGRGWLGARTAIHPATVVLAVSAGLAVLAGAILHRWWRGSIVAATLLAALMIQGAEVFGLQPHQLDDPSVRALARRIWEQAPDADVYINEVAGNKPLTVQVAAEAELLLGRVVHWTPDPNALAAAQPGRPVALILSRRREKGVQPPIPVPAGWEKLGQEFGRRLDAVLLVRR
jgi:4-amino-4-deoxy-L-arabinose transferase-like glycosyltransferase